MKFLVRTWPSPDYKGPLPSAEAFEAQTDWFRAPLAAGVIDAAHHGEAGALFIFDAEAMEALLAEVPLSDHMARSIADHLDSPAPDKPI